MKSIQGGGLMVDVRRTNEVADVTFDVPNYVNIPLDELEDRYKEIPTDRDVVLVCRSGERSLKAIYYLMNQGYRRISNMKGGILSWASKGFPTSGNTQGLMDNLACDCSKPDCC